MKLSLEDTEQVHTEHRKQTQIPNERREIQKEAKQLGLKDAMKVQGL